MNTIVLAALSDWLDFLPLILLLAWGLRKGLGEGIHDPPKRPGRQPVKPVRKHPHPKQDLEEFLKELLGGEESGQPTAAVGKVRRGTVPEPAVVPELLLESDEDSATAPMNVAGRHLRSQLEDRHRASLHSNIEGRHIESHVSEGTLVDAGLRRPESPLNVRPPGISPAAVEPGIASVFRNKTELTHVFILSQILGPPPGLLDD